MSLPAIDTLLFLFINKDLHNEFFDVIMPFVTKRAYLIFLPLCLFFFLKDKKRAVIATIVGFASVLIGDWASNELKYFFERLRPCAVLEGIRLFVGCGDSFSMPSNHAVNAFAFMTPFFILIKNKFRYVFATVAAAVAFSRIYVGVHYPSDVIVGAALGVILSVSVMRLYDWSSERFQVKPHSTLLLISLLAISLFRIYYILNGPLDLSPDEAHYWEWSRRPDLSYYSKGPMIAYLIYLGTHVFGDSVFGIRIMAVIFSALGSIFIYLLGKKLYTGQVGLGSALLIQIIPLFAAYGILFTIDSPFIFFWVLSLFLFWKSISDSPLIKGDKGGCKADNGKENEKQPPPPPLLRGNSTEFEYWILLGISIGLGLLTKYTMAFFYPCAFLFLVFSKERRRLLMTKWPYVAVIFSLLVFSPVIIWNANHDWVTLRHTAGQAHIAEGIRMSFKSLLEFIGSQLGVITPLLFLLMAASIWKLRKEQEGRFLFWFFIPIFVFFLLKSMKAKVQANWALPCYIPGVIAFSVFCLRRFQEDRKKSEKIFIASALMLSLIVTSAGHYSSLLNLPVKMDPGSRLLGWRNLGEEISGLYQQMALKGPVFIFSDKYQISSELAFYVTGHPTTYCINLDRRMNQYDLWPGFGNLIHYNAIFVRADDTELPEKVSTAFHKVEKKVFTAYTKKHGKIRDYAIFVCYDFRGLSEEKPETF